jgi:hypothetical protein
VKGKPGLLNLVEEARMDRKFFIRGYNEIADFPVLYDDHTYSLEEASMKAKEYLLEKGLLSKVIIYEQDEGEEGRATKFICKNKFGKLEEIGGWFRR